MRRLRRWLARAIEETGAFWWYWWRIHMRNQWRAFVRWRHVDVDVCYTCALVYPSTQTRAFATSDGDEHRVCRECATFHRILDLASKAGAR